MRRCFMAMVVLSYFLIAGCDPAQKHRTDSRDDAGDKVSAGIAQRKIRTGMSGSDVVFVLGSPNIITTHGQHKETWVYNEITAKKAYSYSEACGGGSAFGAVSSAKASSMPQRPLAIIVMFDDGGRVRDFQCVFTHQQKEIQVVASLHPKLRLTVPWESIEGEGRTRPAGWISAMGMEKARKKLMAQLAAGKTLEELEE